MPNVATVLKQEMSRLGKKEAKAATEPVRKASAQHRRDIAALKREMDSLRRELQFMKKQLDRQGETIPQDGDQPSRFRFSAKGLRSHRERLGLSASDFGKLLGVSGQSVYNWESESARPRTSQLAAIAEVRSLGRREALHRLEQMED